MSAERTPPEDEEFGPTEISKPRSDQTPTEASGPPSDLETELSKPSAPRPPRATASSDVGETIGKFRILKKLGEGGMGVVYLAEQSEPVRRQVALKVIKLGMDTAEVVARFGAERQALAVMDHPSIASVYEAGATDNGRPYFVMELVVGVPIDSYCDQHNLTPRQRLELFIPVCQAVQHAHQKGVIHRDLKPSNILVATVDGAPVPKVIDFGVAKATDRRLDERKMFTETGQLIGTPEYMSPEQADLSGLDVDTRTDVYSLGVVLYHLLSGQLPLDGKTLRSSGFVEMQRLIREKEPPKPSTLVGRLGDRTDEVARRRGTEPRVLSRQLKGDLDWIVMKALEKERSRRYETANGFALDIQRYLDDEPVQARPSGAAYRMGKFVRRNRLAVAMVSALMLALVAGMIGTGVGFVRAKREATKARAISGFLTDMLSSVDPKEAQGKEVTVREVLDEAAKKVDNSFGDQPEIKGAVSETIGAMYTHLGLFDAAAPHLESALKINRDHFGEDGQQTIDSLNQLAVMYFGQGKYEEAEPLFVRSLDVMRRVHGEDHPMTLTTLQNLAAVYLGLEQYDEAEPLLLQVVEGRRRVLGEEHSATLSSMNNLAHLYTDTGRYAEAEPLLVRTLEIRRRTLGDSHPRTLISAFNLADLYLKTGRFAEAEPLLVEARDGFGRVLGEEHPYTVEAVKTLADLLTRTGRTTEASKVDN